MPKIKVAQDLIDFFYPVGSYYETSDINFNPNITWGGTWKEDSAGRVLVAYDPTQTEFNSNIFASTSGDHTHTISGSIGSSGSGNAQNIQPSVVAKRWHRIA